LQITSMKFDGRIETETGKGTGITDWWRPRNHEERQL
jgi:hypothetical protein